MSKNALANNSIKQGKNLGRIFRFSASGTRKTKADSAREQKVFASTKSDWRAIADGKEIEEVLA